MKYNIYIYTIYRAKGLMLGLDEGRSVGNGKQCSLVWPCVVDGMIMP